MARTPDANVEPEILRWARESIGYSIADAARKLRLRGGEERLARWEDGEERPTVAQLRKVAQVYRRPLAVFFLPEPPTDFQVLRDFRRVPGAEEGVWSPELHVAVIRAEEQRGVALDLADVLGDEPPDAPRVELSNDPEAVAAQVRAILDISLRDQVGWNDPRLALRSWIAAVEESGVLVLQAQKVAVEEMRGFSLSDDPLPVVVLNGGDSRRGRIFTLLHEFAHVVLHTSGVCDLYPVTQARSDADRTEAFCNQVAACVLLPRDAFLAERTVRTHEGEEWPEEALSRLADRYAVSREVVLRRLLTLGKTTVDHYLTQRERFIEEYQEAQARRREGREIRVPYYRLKVRDLGRRYVELALDAYHSAAISTSEAADALDVPVPGIAAIEREAGLTSGAE